MLMVFIYVLVYSICTNFARMIFKSSKNLYKHLTHPLAKVTFNVENLYYELEKMLKLFLFFFLYIYIFCPYLDNNIIIIITM